MINIGILTNLNDQLLPFLLKKISNLKNVKFYLILAKVKNDNSKSTKIFKERTGNYFLKHKLDFFNSGIKLPMFLVSSHNSRDFYKIIKSNQIKFLYNSGTPNKLNRETISKVKGIINIHPGILPNYRGCTCPEWTLYNNDILGITAHLMDEGYDSGPILKKKIIKFKKRDIKDYKDIRIKIFLLTFELAKEIFQKITRLELTSQDESKAKYHSVIGNRDLNNLKYKIKKKTYVFNKKNLVK